MGYFGYKFVNLSPEEVATRRLALDKHAQIAQLSQIVVLLGLFGLTFGSRLITRWTAGDAESVPGSPQKKYLAEGREKSIISNLAKKWRTMMWKLDDEVSRGCGTWGQWAGGSLWAVWLFVLCVQGTAPDYMHLTKSFGLVAASQLPLHYLLAMKSPYSPIQLLLRTSHENLNRAHQVLGRVIMLFLFLHAGFYVYFFIKTGFWVNRFKDLDVILGLIDISIIALIGSSAMGFVRRWNYRLFFSIHAVAPIVFLVLIFFHVHHIRVYVVEALIVALSNFALRVWSSKSVPAEITKVAGTGLVHMSLQAPASKRRWAAGNHVYVRHAPGLLSYLKANPFTISSLPNEDGRVELMARVLNGNTKKLESMTIESSNAGDVIPTTMSMEGPYGHSNHLPDLAQFERILFVAGGVGATFILPLWHRCTDQRAADALKYQNVKLIWSVKRAEDCTWAFDSSSLSRRNGNDERELYITTNEMKETNDGASVEMSSIDNDKDLSFKMKEEGFSVHTGRPDLRLAVDELVAGASGQVAVFVCGPFGLSNALRRYVGRWVVQGAEVYWHAEDFGL